MVEYNKAKLKEQKSSRLTDSKKGLAVTRGKELGRVGGEGGSRGLRGIMIGTLNNLGAGHREDSIACGRQVVTLLHLTTLIDSDCNGGGVRGGLDNMGECCNQNVAHVKPS